MSKKRVLSIVVFIILLMAIPATMYLVRQQQTLKSRAAFIPKLEFVDATGKVITETTNPNVKLRITKEQTGLTPSPSPTASPSPSPTPVNIQVTTVDSQASFYGTYQSHNQKVVSNQNGYFMTYVHQTTNKDASNENDTWRLARSIDGGTVFTTVYEGNSGTRAPVIETDSDNIYLIEGNWLNPTNNAHFYKFSSSNNYQSPVIQITLNLGVISAKYAMEIDEIRGQLYYFTLPGTFTVLGLDGTIKKQYQLTRNGPNAGMHYPYLYLDENNYLYAAWTTSPEGSTYRSIHFIRSKDGGNTWEKPNGQALTAPIIADESGPTDRITLDDEYNSNPWLSTFIVKAGKVHFMYYARAPLNRQHYVRYDLTVGTKDIDIYPFKGETITFAGLDGYCVTNRVSTDTRIYCINRNFGPYVVGVLKSSDNGTTWHDFVLAPTNTVEIYSLGGSPQITGDGYIIGSYTESSNFGDSSVPKIVKFFKVPI